MWDLLGKSVGRPVYQLLGGAVRTSIPVYGSSMRRDIIPNDEAERLAQLAATQGFRAFKIRVAETMGRNTDPWQGRSETLVRIVREMLGSDVVLHADANGGYAVPEAVRMGSLLEELRYGHFEEPCPWNELESTAQVTRALDIAAAGGEQDNVLEQFQRIVSQRVVDIVQPDIGYVGGMSRARKVAQMAEAVGLVTTPHCANRSMLQVVAGEVRVGSEPGWGIEVLPEFLSASDRRETR